MHFHKQETFYTASTRVLASPMTREDYNHYRGWETPVGENPNDPGMLIEKEPTEGYGPNHPSHTGYIYWKPLDVFNASYVKSGSLGFGEALHALKNGSKVARAGWNGKGMWLKMVPTALAEKVAFEYEALGAAPWIGMKTADEKFVPWLANQTDVLATDWAVVQ